MLKRAPGAVAVADHQIVFDRLVGYAATSATNSLLREWVAR